MSPILLNSAVQTSVQESVDAYRVQPAEDYHDHHGSPIGSSLRTLAITFSSSSSWTAGSDSGTLASSVFMRGCSGNEVSRPSSWRIRWIANISTGNQQYGTCSNSGKSFQMPGQSCPSDNCTHPLVLPKRQCRPASVGKSRCRFLTLQ